MVFTKAEIERYSRHLILPEFGLEGQKRLKESSVLVVGAGGLGSPLLQYLAAAGVGRIGIIDNDVVDASNLQRQVLYGEDSLGLPKVEEAKKRVLSINPHIKVETYHSFLSTENALDIINNYDVVADGTDNFPTRYLVNDACVLLGKVNVYASIFRFEGQVSVFNYKDDEGKLGPNYRDLFPSPPPPGMVPSCAEGGVLGVLPGIVGSFQCLEVIKVLTGIGKPLAGRLFLIDTLSFTSRTLKIFRDPQNPLNGDNPTQKKLVNYEQFCGIDKAKDQLRFENMKTKDVHELKKMLDQGDDFQLIDVREPNEYEFVNINGELMPMSNIDNFIDKISKDKTVIVHCRSGKRSGDVIKRLEKEHGFDNLYNLEGGILAYAKEINPELPTY
ncbi:MAG: molybdopterin-synthase adenylyltransferase MoeB [Bacteroidia bacterium]|nr:molybdopterin-synthase adenylyltransferase MoeB [Bacteroidia bacterium]